MIPEWYLNQKLRNSSVLVSYLLYKYLRGDVHCAYLLKNVSMLFCVLWLKYNHVRFKDIMKSFFFISSAERNRNLNRKRKFLIWCTKFKEEPLRQKFKILETFMYVLMVESPKQWFEPALIPSHILTHQTNLFFKSILNCTSSVKTHQILFWWISLLSAL